LKNFGTPFFYSGALFQLRINRSILIYGVIFANLLLNSELSIAQSSSQKEFHLDETLSEIEVTATRSKKKIINVPAALSKTSSREIRFGLPQLSLDESLSSIPGIFSQNQFNSVQDLRLSIRGFGVRSAFGIRGIKVLVDGISHTLPDGQSQVDSIDPGLIDSIEILRGPSSSLYGGASGGVISIITNQGNGLGSTFENQFEFGQFGLKKNWLNVKGVSGPVNYRLYASYLSWEGYRNHSATENSLVNGKFQFKTESNSKWTLIFNHFYSPWAEDPGALTKAQVQSNRKGADSRSITFDVGEEVKQNNLALIYQKNLSTYKFFVTAHLNQRLFKNKLPFTSGGRVEFERWAPGIEGRAIFEMEVFGKPGRLISGVDFSLQSDARKRFDNNNGTPGDKTLDRLETVYNLGPYLRAEWQWTTRLEVVGGFRYDRVNFKLDDAYLDDGDQSDDLTLSEMSGTVGSVLHWNESINLYANISTVFETPTTTELANDPAGGSGFNNNLNSQHSVSYEVGLKGRAVSGLELDLALFIIRSKDELISYEIDSSPGRTFYKNAGQSRRVGLEARLVNHPANWIKTSFSYTISDFKFTEFDDSGVDQSGHFIPGIPNHHLSLNLDMFSKLGWFTRGEIQYVSSFFVDNGNTVKNSSYTTSRLTIGHEKKIKSFKGSAFFGLNNFFDEKYNANTRINATGGRYFEPAPPLNAFGGVSLTYYVE
jgi:iron complex outermembrane recepter protein